MARITRPIARAGTAVLAVLALVALAATRFDLSAIEGPGAAETYLATMGKRWLVARGARSVVLPEVGDVAESAGRGLLAYGGSCSYCHGVGGRRNSDVGLWMSPRAPELTPALIGQWTDDELFWIIKNGIRMTGMPGFARIHTDQQVADLVYYLRDVAPPSTE